MKRTSLLFGVLLLAVVPAAFADTAHGVVFDDRDRDGKLDPGEPGIEGVAVSNGADVVLTGKGGRYALPVEDGSIVFVTKPGGFAVPLSEDRLPHFYYVHAPEGTPAEAGLRYPGLEPSGPLPESIDFPLTPVEEPERFRVVLFADPQPQTAREVGYVRDDVVAELVGIEAAFGMTLGDIMFDDLSLLPRQNRIIGRIGIPWYNVPGNHELNYRSPDDRWEFETFKRHFGPTYYSFDYANAHFVAMDSVHYLGRDTSEEDPHPRGQGSYEGRFGERQLTWLANDLRRVPAERLVVFTMHIPLRSVFSADRPNGAIADRDRFFEIVKDLPHVLVLSGHMHTNEHTWFDDADGFEGARPLHQHSLGAVSGSWWSGPFDERGIPTTEQRDGTPNGYYLMEIDGVDARLRFKAAGRDDGFQMRISLDPWYHRYNVNGMRDYRMGELIRGTIGVDQLPATEVVANVFNGGPRTRVTCTVDGGEPATMTRTVRQDPFVEALYLRNEDTIKSWVGVEESSHVWTIALPRDLSPGAHTLEVRAQDDYGAEHAGSLVFEVTAP